MPSDEEGVVLEEEEFLSADDVPADEDSADDVSEDDVSEDDVSEDDVPRGKVSGDEVQVVGVSEVGEDEGEVEIERAGFVTAKQIEEAYRTRFAAHGYKSSKKLDAL